MLFADRPKGNKFSNAGVGENNINSPRHFSDCLVKTIKIGKLGNIALNSKNMAPDRLHRLVKFSLSAARYEHIRTLLDEKLRGGESNPFCPPGDDGGFAFQPFGHCHSPSSPCWELPYSETLGGVRLPVICRRKDILHKFFKRSRCAVLPRTRLLRSEESCIDGLEHLDIHRGFLRRKTRLRQRLSHLVIRKLLVTQIRFANAARNYRGSFRHRQVALAKQFARLFA